MDFKMLVYQRSVINVDDNTSIKYSIQAVTESQKSILIYQPALRLERHDNNKTHKS